MHDELRMRVGDRVGNHSEQRSPRMDIERVMACIRGYRLTVHVIHDIERSAVRGHSPIDQAHDVRVIQPREDASLLQKAAQDCVSIHAAFEHLDGDLLLVGAIGTFGQPDHAHATLAQESQQSIRSCQAIGGHAIHIAIEYARHSRCGIAIKQAAHILVGHQQGANFIGQRAIGCCNAC